MALRHQPPTHVLALHMNSANRAAMVVMSSCRDSNALTQHPMPERIPRLLAARLADFWRINPLNPHFQRWQAGAGFNPQRVAIDHARNDT